MSSNNTIVYKYRNYKSSYMFLRLILGCVGIFLILGKSKSNISWYQNFLPIELHTLAELLLANFIFVTLEFIFDYIFVNMTVSSKKHLYPISQFIEKNIKPILYFSLNTYILYIIIKEFNVFIEFLFSTPRFMANIILWIFLTYFTLLYLFSNDFLRFDLYHKIIENNFTDYDFQNKKQIYKLDQITLLEITGQKEDKRKGPIELTSISFNLKIDNTSFSYIKDFHVSEILENKPSQDLAANILFFKLLSKLCNLEIKYDEIIKQELDKNVFFRKNLYNLLNTEI